MLVVLHSDHHNMSVIYRFADAQVPAPGARGAAPPDLQADNHPRECATGGPQQEMQREAQSSAVVRTCVLQGQLGMGEGRFPDKTCGEVPDSVMQGLGTGGPQEHCLIM